MADKKVEEIEKVFNKYTRDLGSLALVMSDSPEDAKEQLRLAEEALRKIGIILAQK